MTDWDSKEPNAELSVLQLVSPCIKSLCEKAKAQMPLVSPAKAKGMDHTPQKTDAIKDGTLVML